MRQQKALKFSKDIAGIAKLVFDHNIEVIFDDVAENSRISRLFEFLPPKDDHWLKEFFPNYDPAAEPALMIPTIFDVLGEYSPAESRITIYSELCRAMASLLDLDSSNIIQVVLAHEEAHALTHLGEEVDGTIWRHFAYASSMDKELFAQAYALLVFQHLNLCHLEEAFRKLSLN